MEVYGARVFSQNDGYHILLFMFVFLIIGVNMFDVPLLSCTWQAFMLISCN